MGKVKISPEEIIEAIECLPEIEILEVMKGLANHLSRFKMEHLIDEVFDMDDLKEAVSSLEDDIEELKKERDDLQGNIDRAINILS